MRSFSAATYPPPSRRLDARQRGRQLEDAVHRAVAGTVRRRHVQRPRRMSTQCRAPSSQKGLSASTAPTSRNTRGAPSTTSPATRQVEAPCSERRLGNRGTPTDDSVQRLPRLAAWTSGSKERPRSSFGGDSGIGWHTAKLLLAEGVDRRPHRPGPGALDEAAAKLDAPDGTLHAFAADVDERRVARRPARAGAEAVGDIDILVQSAGITGAQGLFHEIDDEGWTNTIEVDLMGPVRLVATFLPTLRTGGWGRLVFLASEDAVQPYDDEIPYCAAKAGVLALTKGLSRSYAKEGLLVNAVSPAFIHTPMTDAMMEKRADELGTRTTRRSSSSSTRSARTWSSSAAASPTRCGRGRVPLLGAASFVNGSNYRVDAAGQQHLAAHGVVVSPTQPRRRGSPDGRCRRRSASGPSPAARGRGRRRAARRRGRSARAPRLPRPPERRGADSSAIRVSRRVG